MNLSPNRANPSIAVLEMGDKWKNAIKLACPNLAIKPAALDEQFRQKLRYEPGMVAVIELTAELPDLTDRLRFVGFNAQNPNQPCLIGALDDKLSGLKKEISQFGFCRIFDNLFQIKDLTALVHNHWNSIPWPEMSIEQRVQSRLPWTKTAEIGMNQTNNNNN